MPNTPSKDPSKRRPSNNDAAKTPLVTPPNSDSKKRCHEAVFHSLEHNDRNGHHHPSSSARTRGLDMGVSVRDTLEASSRPPNEKATECGGSQHSRPATPQSQAMTQPVNYSQDLRAGLEDATTTRTTNGVVGTLVDWNDKTNCTNNRNSSSSNNKTSEIEIRKLVVTLGRLSDCDIKIENRSIGRKHCSLTFVEMDGTCYLTCLKSQTCWIRDFNASHWKLVKEDTIARIRNGQRFRLLPPGKTAAANSPGAEYVLNLKLQGNLKTIHPGSHSFDVEYLKLLRTLQCEGQQKLNKKGANWALPLCCPMTINLRDTSGKDRNLLPLTSLRSLYGGRGALFEALWYLRGEDDISFLQANSCNFWDKQAIQKDNSEAKNWVGLNYGLLTHFPQTQNGKQPINQLEEYVIKVLEKPGSCSRNMICSLVNPGEDTVQGACTSSIQFSVSMVPSVTGGAQEEALHLTVNQRSSDVVLGLPHDVVCWSIILHLIRREVGMRTGRKLAAGNLSFVIGQNAAHVYNLNYKAMKEILQREPKEECQPHLEVNEAFKSRSMFDLAKNFEPGMFRVCDYTRKDYHPYIKLHQAL